MLPNGMRNARPTLHRQMLVLILMIASNLQPMYNPPEITDGGVGTGGDDSDRLLGDNHSRGMDPRDESVATSPR